MRGFVQLAWIEFKLFLREPSAAFFTLVFPMVMLFIFGNIYGNAPQDGRLGAVDYSVPGYIGMIIGTTALMCVPIHVASYREQGVLRRFRATPLHPLAVLGAALLTELAATVLGVILLVAAGHLFFDLHLPAGPLAVVVALLVSTICMYAVGFLLAAVAPTARAANAIGMAAFFPMMFLAGSAMPRYLMPEKMQRLGEYLPLTHVVELLRKVWFEGAWDGPALAVLAGMLVVGAALSARQFRWQ